MLRPYMAACPAASPAPDRPQARGRRGSRRSGCGPTVPLALGQRTLYFRDVFTTHLPVKAFGAAQLRQGRIPAFNPTWGLGQPFRGNPNALPFYPGNLLYLVLPFWIAFNLHYALHWLLAALTMAALARALGQGQPAALVAGLTYAGSGWMLTGLSFYNLLAVSAWWPLVLLGAARGGRRGIALGGLACGLALLAGEPVTAALGVVPLLLVACQRHGSRRGSLAALGIGFTGLLIALPQLVATARILGFTSRGALGAAGIGGGRFHLGLGAAAGAARPLPLRPPLGPRQGRLLAVGRSAGAALHPHPASRDRRPLARPAGPPPGAELGGCSRARGSPSPGPARSAATPW